MRTARGLSLCLLAALLSVAAAQDDWKIGRATFYGLDGGASIHKGACGLGYQYKNVGTGWDIAAISDASPEFAGSCGRCYEVRCDPRKVVDGYGNSIDRSDACKAGSASIVVRTVDNCPCQYPSNAYSNKRWCCGDNSDTQGTHIDLSIWAFEKLADAGHGTAGIQFRRVPCSYRPSNPAPDGPTSMPASQSPGALGLTGTPFDPATDISQQKLVMRFDNSGKEQGAVRPMQHFDAGTDAAVVTMGDYMHKQGGSGIASSAAATSAAATSASATSSASAAALGSSSATISKAPSPASGDGSNGSNGNGSNGSSGRKSPDPSPSPSGSAGSSSSGSQGDTKSDSTSPSPAPGPVPSTGSTGSGSNGNKGSSKSDRKTPSAPATRSTTSSSSTLASSSTGSTDGNGGGNGGGSSDSGNASGGSASKRSATSNSAAAAGSQEKQKGARQQQQQRQKNGQQAEKKEQQADTKQQQRKQQQQQQLGEKQQQQQKIQQNLQQRQQSQQKKRGGSSSGFAASTTSG